jgi:photosystem II stability/assembly factor-like uncharacterized protein
MKKYYFTICIMLISALSFAQWTTCISGTSNDLYSIHFPDYNHGYVAGEGMYRWSGSNCSWVGMGSSTDIYYSVYFTSADTGCIVGGTNFEFSGNYGIVRKTTSGSSGFNLVYTDDTLMSVYFTDNLTGYAVGVNGLIQKTIDGGGGWSSWTNLTSGTTNQLWSVYFPDDVIGYVAGVSGTILKTMDGVTWASQISGTTVDLYSIYFTDVNTGYAVGDNGTILKTSDGGTTWTPQISGISNNLRSIHFPSPNIGYIAGYGGKILKTYDGGLNWVETLTGVGNNLNSVYFLDDNTGYTAGNNGIILKTTDGGGITNINNYEQNKNISIFPNPSTGKITINVDEVENIEVINLQGKEIYNGIETEINLNSYSKGIYIIKVTTNNQTITQKLIKQ